MGFMDRDSPSESKWYLCDRSLDLPSFFDRPLSIVSDNLRAIWKFYNGESFISTRDVADCPIRISGFEIILYEHDTSTDFEDETLWSEASFFESFHQWK